MKKLALLLITFCSFSLSGCFESAPKCNDEVTTDLVKEILLKDEWFFVRNGFTKETLMTMAIENLTFEKLDMVIKQGFFADIMKPHINLRDYSYETAHISLGDFMIESVEKQSQKSYCSATLEIEYPEMPQEMRQEYTNGMLKDLIFDGGKVMREVAYSARYTDDGKKIYVELLED